MCSNTTDVETDVAVVGAGMAGLVAAARATELGADVELLEKGPRPGGSMYLSGGAIWTLDSFEAAREKIPHGNPELQQLVVDSFEDAIEWLEELGANVKGPQFDLPGRERTVDPPDFTDHMVAVLEEAGVEVRLRTPVTGLRTDESGDVTGVTASGPDGRTTVDANSTVLATGGFQGNEELLKRYVTDHPENVRLRSNPWSTGDGLQAATDIGAKTTHGMGAFYGHNLLARPAQFSPLEFREATQYYGPMTVALDEDGRRYTDETISAREETLAQDTAKHAGGTGYLVIDDDLYDVPFRESKTIGDIVETARKYDGRVAECDSLDALKATLDEWGVNGRRAVSTLERFNRAVRTDSFDLLDHPREDNRHPIDTPPFHVVAVQPGITFTMGGLSVTGEMRVRRRATSSSDLDPGYVPETNRTLFEDTFESLFAAGVDVGNVSHRRYMGGLSQALVTGKIAGEGAARNAGAN
jgi:succinate dehydrogenase/fumarate reductase flavoprotein subunit